jgi:hypothetical protein
MGEPDHGSEARQAVGPQQGVWGKVPPDLGPTTPAISAVKIINYLNKYPEYLEAQHPPTAYTPPPNTSEY